MTLNSSDHLNPKRKGTKPFPPILKPIVSSLAIRKEPRVENSTLIHYVRQDETLYTIETENPVAKIGVKGQWLHVRTEGGTEGYIAAWFVERV